MSAIVLNFGLQEDFLSRLASPPRFPSGNGFIFGPHKRKKSLDVSPFTFTDENAHTITKKILDAMECPYVVFARSPDELILAKPLFAANPAIPHALLATLHFETLLLAETARSRSAGLTRAVEELSAQIKDSNKKPKKKNLGRHALEKSVIDALRRQIEALDEYIQFVENRNGGEGEKCPEN